LDDSGSSNLRELNWLLKKNVMIRRLKSEVMSELPEKVRKRIHVDILDKEVRKEMDEVLAEAGELDSKVAGKAGPGAKQKAETDKMVAMNTVGGSAAPAFSFH
jgi:SWI/SNF-related matrix-associated actin-dependent regulator 1 of chromatin subfamily A